MPTESLATAAREVEALQESFAAADTSGRQDLLAPIHDPGRLDDFREGDTRLTLPDARLIVANRNGYALWRKYELYLSLDSRVRDLIAAVRVGDIETARDILAAAPQVANPVIEPGLGCNLRTEAGHIANDSIPLFCLSEGVFNDTNQRGNEGEIAELLLSNGADPDLAWQPMEGAVSFNCPSIAAALIRHGANVEGPSPGVLLAYPMLFGYTTICEQLAAAGARLDLRFAAGLGHLAAMEACLNDDDSLKEDPGLADPYANQSPSPIRVPRSDAVVLGQALLYACLHGRLGAAKWLIEHNANPSALVLGTDHDCTILQRMTCHFGGSEAKIKALETSRMPMVRWLLDRGADPAIQDAEIPADALGWARHHGMHGMAKLFEHAGEDKLNPGA